jgi:uncharacterized protein YbcC (UPF0753/DUF2309 family)
MDDKYFEEIMTLTGTPEFATLVEELERMVYNLQANAFDATSWEQVQEDKGFAKGLAYIINLRENTKLEKKHADI